jgi:excisionase family DNA binding protein
MTTFLTIEQVAERVHRSPRTVQRWCQRRMIPHVKIGRSTLITEEQLAEFADAYTREPDVVVPEHDLPNPAYRGPVVVPMRRSGDAA